MFWRLLQDIGILASTIASNARLPGQTDVLVPITRKYISRICERELAPNELLEIDVLRQFFNGIYRLDIGCSNNGCNCNFSLQVCGQSWENDTTFILCRAPGPGAYLRLTKSITFDI